MPKFKLPGWAAAAAALTISIVGSMALHRQFQNALITQAARTQEAIDYARIQYADARALEQAAAQSANEAARERARADEAERKLAASKTRFVTVAATAPDTCAPVIAAATQALADADSTIGALKGSNDSLSVAYEAEKRAAAALRAGLDRVIPAAEKLVDKSKRGFFESLIPKVSFSVTAGVDAVDKDFAVTAGPSLSWEF